MNRQNMHKMMHIFPITASLIVLCQNAVSMLERNHSLFSLGLFMYADFILVQYCHHAFQKLPPRQKSLRRWLLRFALFLLFSGVFCAIVSQSAPFYGPLAAGFLYAMAVGAVAFVFYAYMIYDGDDNCQDQRLLQINYISEKV